MGRDRLGVMIGRKIRYSWQTGTAMLTGNYEFPIVARNMAPAREACENCHKPSLFSTDTLREIRSYAEDEKNTATSTFLAIKTGGGMQREGLGFGIHWHIENPVYFFATDTRSQNIPYVVVERADGTRTEYIDVESGFDPTAVNPDQLQVMDCITCHNRTAHLMDMPSDTVDELITRGLVSQDLPDIKRRAVAVMREEYSTEQEAMDAIAALGEAYKNENNGSTAVTPEKVDQAVAALQEAWNRTHFPAQETGPETHPNNLAHKDSPGCFRCHDGKHLSADGLDAVRLECNLCHSIPVVSGGEQLTASLELSKGFEPESHKNANWITLHRDIFDETCAGCHTVEDPGGTSNTSFCSNSVCHGSSWEFAGFDAPKLREALMSQVEQMSPTLVPTPTTAPQDDIGVGPEPTKPAAEATATPAGQAEQSPVTYDSLADTFQAKCGACHGSAKMKGLNVLTYVDLMKGGDSGPAVVPGDPDASLLVQVQEGTHPGKFSEEELALVIQWISEGAKER